MKWLAWGELALVISLGTAGQLLLKYALRLHAGEGFNRHLLISPAMLGWFFLYAATTVLWLLALRSIPLSQAFPILGLQFALIPLTSSRFLHERITGLQWLGVVAIAAGVALVGQS
jgi:undecaprenyl phosphate-alpha-L-ara4N flippase subunit ArnE